MGSFGFGFSQTRAGLVNYGGIAPQPVIIALLAGQSNMEGRNPIDGTDPNPELFVDVTDIYQFGGDSAGSYYQTLSADITPLEHPGQTRRVGPDHTILTQLKADNPTAKIIGVPLATGSSAIVGGAWESNATPGAGGSNFELMITNGNLAIAAAQDEWPGASITVRFYWSQGEQDASNAVARATYAAALQNVISRARSRITGASSALWTLSSIVPRRWANTNDPDYHVSNYTTASENINLAHIDVALADPNVIYVRGPDLTNDNLHYQGHAAVRTLGARMATAIADAAGPTITTTATASVYEDAALTVVLAHDDPWGHATFAITGGADAAEFVLSDPYLPDVTLEWAGATPAVGDYEVIVTATDGRGNVGTPKTFTITVETAVLTKSIVLGSAVTTAITGAFGTWTAAAFPIKTGANVIFVRGGTGGYKTSAAMTVDGNAATKIHDPGSGSLGTYAFVYNHAGADTTLDVVMTHDGSAMSNISLGSIVMTGYDMTPTQTEFNPDHATDAGPWTTASLTCPAGGIVVGYMHRNATVSGAASGNTFLGAHGVPTNRSGAAYREDTGIMSLTGTTGTSNTIWAFAFAEA